MDLKNIKMQKTSFVGQHLFFQAESFETTIQARE